MSKYCPEVVDEICKNLKEKHGRVYSVKAAGIGFETFCRWLEEKQEFRDVIKRAEYQGQTKQKEDLLFIIEEHAKKSWQAAAWILERKYSEEFALKTKQEFSGYIEAAEADKEKKERMVRLKTFLNDIKVSPKKELIPA